jgi:hypothetical protein
MNLPNNFPLTEEQIGGIESRLKGVDSYKGMGVAGPIRDLKKCFDAMGWLLTKWEKWKNDRQVAENQNVLLKTYLTQTESVLALYANGNWDGGAAANQLMSNLPQIP